MTLTKHLFTISASMALFTSFAVALPSDPVFMGPGSCSSSNCHGDIKPRNSSNVLQNEYTTWSKHDRHSKAYLTLLNQDSKTIASNLGITDASKAPLCLSCHATYVEEASQKGERFRLEDGVACESCHGAANGWLKTHAETGTTHADNVKNGLTDLVPLDARASLCLSCHYGNDEKTVNHNLYGAGHPRLSFELDTFGVLQPKHWVVDSDYEKRKAPYIPVVAWMTGQARHADEALKALASEKRSKNGTFPELSLFDCFSCHHSLAEEQWKHRSYGGNPGQLKLNLPSLVILKEAIAPLDQASSDQMGELLSSLHKEYQATGAKDSIASLTSLVEDKVIPLIARMPHDLGTTSKILSRIASFASTYQWPTFEVAEQLGMGIQATLATSPQLAKVYAVELKELFATLKSSKSFKAERFTAAAKKLSASVVRAPR